MKLPKPYHQTAGAVLYHGDALKVLRRLPDESVDLVFADPPYLLSNGGTTCQGGRMVSVDKGKWDASRGFEADYKWNRRWLVECQRILRPNGTIWVSGTNHNIFLVGHAMQSLGFRVLNDICWYKPNAAPNLGCRCFTHSHETLLWAARSEKSKHVFNYMDMKTANGGKQMRSVWPPVEGDQSIWTFQTPKRAEKSLGRHPTQKPVALLERIILSSTKPGDSVLDPFVGSGTTCVAAVRHGRACAGIDASEEYLRLALARITEEESRPNLGTLESDAL